MLGGTDIRMDNENVLLARHAVLGIRIGLASSNMNTNTICYIIDHLTCSLPTLNFTSKNCVSGGRGSSSINLY